MYVLLFYSRIPSRKTLLLISSPKSLPPYVPHWNRKCSTFSPFSLHSLQILSALLFPLHLPIIDLELPHSLLNSAISFLSVFFLLLYRTTSPLCKFLTFWSKFPSFNLILRTYVHLSVTATCNTYIHTYIHTCVLV